MPQHHFTPLRGVTMRRMPRSALVSNQPPRSFMFRALSSRSLFLGAALAALAPFALQAQATSTTCSDGTTSTATGRGACSGHGGVAKKGAKADAKMAKSDAKAARSDAKADVKADKGDAKAAKAADKLASKSATSDVKQTGKSSTDAAGATARRPSRPQARQPRRDCQG